MVKSTVERSCLKLEGGQYSTLALSLLKEIDIDDGQMVLNATQEEQKKLAQQVSAVLTKAYYESLFECPAIVLEIVREWNREDNLGYTDADFRDAWHRAPPKPDMPLTGAVLVPYCRQEVEAMYEYATAKAMSGFGIQHEAVLVTEACLRLRPSIVQPQRRLRWEVINFGARMDEASLAGQQAIAPHVGILVALAQHRRYAAEFGSRRVPSVMLPGYEVRFKEFSEWSGILFAASDDGKGVYGYEAIANPSRNHNGHRLLLNAIPRTWNNSHLVVPEMIDIT